MIIGLNYFKACIRSIAILFIMMASAYTEDSHQPFSHDAKQMITVEEIDDIILGSADAPITLVEYSSINCVHCADFHTVYFDELEKKYIQTGKVKYVLKYFPIDFTAVEYMSLIVAQPKEQWFTLLTKAFRSQKEWLGKPPEKLGEILGLLPKECQKALGCVANQDKIVAKRFNAEQHIEIDATPTFQLFYVSGQTPKQELYNRGLAPKDLEQRLDQLVKTLP